MPLVTNDTQVISQPLAFNARKYADGNVSGNFVYHQTAGGETVKVQR